MDGWMDGWLLSAVEGTVRRMANGVVLRAILSILTSQPQDLVDGQGTHDAGAGQ